MCNTQVFLLSSLGWSMIPCSLPSPRLIWFIWKYLLLLKGVYWLEGVGYFVSCLSLSPWTFQGFVLATLPSSPLPPSWGHWCSTTSSIFMCILGIHLNSGLHALYWLSHRPPVPTKQLHWHYFQTHVARPLWACECGCRFFWHGVIPAWTLRQILLWTRSYTTCRV